MVATLVEGHGEEAAVPVLLRRLRPGWKFLRPVRCKRDKLIREANYLAKMVSIAVANFEDREAGAVLVIIDAEEGCPAELGPEILAQIRESHRHLPAQVVVANRMFEAWLVAGGAVDGMRPDGSDEIQNPKATITDRLGRYSPVADQARLSSRINPEAAQRNSPSFAKLLRSLDALEPTGSEPSGSLHEQ